MLTSGVALSLEREDPTAGRPPEHPYNLGQAVERFERGFIYNILELTDWDRAQAAAVLGISRQALAQKMQRYHMADPAM